MAGISINLGVFNLMPFPILDGGMIFLLIIESIFRRDLPMPIKERIYQVAFVCILLFAAMVIFNDITKLPFFIKLVVPSLRVEPDSAWFSQWSARYSFATIGSTTRSSAQVTK